jgi:hypothetical protein
VDISTGPAAAGATPWPAWVRRCTACGADDVRALFGRAVIPGEGGAEEPWWCPGCRGQAWEAVACELPAACPHAQARRKGAGR